MKTMIVFTKFRMRAESDWTENSEAAEIGKKAKHDDYKTGTAFLNAIKKMYRAAGAEYRVLNVVIG